MTWHNTWRALIIVPNILLFGPFCIVVFLTIGTGPIIAIALAYTTDNAFIVWVTIAWVIHGFALGLAGEIGLLDWLAIK